MPSTVLILPGLGNSGPQHWQTLWEQAHPASPRVVQKSWDHPVCADWVAAIEGAVRRAGPESVLVAHSLACLAVAHWASAAHAPIKAAMLVAVPNSQRESFPKEAQGFAETPTVRFDFPSLVVASTDDPYGLSGKRRAPGAVWAATIATGALGHINANSGIGDWPEGFGLLKHLLGRSSALC